jgi:hypothetical protein
MITLKRYSELRELSEKVTKNQLKPLCETLDIYLPNFPGKKLMKNRDSLTEKRREKIERWLQLAVKHSSLSKKIMDFLNLSEETIQNELSASAKPDENYVLDFIEKLSGCKNNKLNQIDKFCFMFFSRKRTVSDAVLKKLLEALLPLCGSDLCGGKVVDVLSKLTSSDYFKDFACVCKVFANIDIYLLREMNLNDYLTKKKFVDSQLQVYKLCKIYEENCRSPVLNELVKPKQLLNDKDAIFVYRNWGMQTKQPDQQLSLEILSWRPLISTENMSVKFRFIERQLEISGEIIVESSVQKIINILTVPSERKKWDILLIDMKPVGSNGFIFTYSSEKTVYEFHTLISIAKASESEQIPATVEFVTTCYEKLDPISKIGKINSSYSIEKMDEHVSSTKESQDMILCGLASDFVAGRVKVQWSSSYCQTSFSLVRGDVFQEADVLKKSLDRLICVAEGREEQMESLENPKNPLIDAFERKRLDRAFTFCSSNQFQSE